MPLSDLEKAHEMAEIVSSKRSALRQAQAELQIAEDRLAEQLFETGMVNFLKVDYSKLNREIRNIPRSILDPM